MYKTKTKNTYFFCYSPYLQSWIDKEGIQYITAAINPQTNSLFYMYEQSEELSKAIKSYEDIKQN
ncbi:hypothetical protein [Oceanobacillus kimchii]|uniref:hypothetical protein n=1 Tax=Oceanobacillus kimchii TaxID=746691 RepID=UPI003B019424